MPDRRPPEITESIAEALRAGLALLAVVLLARSHAGALARVPSAWFALPVCGLTWGAAVWAVRWSGCRGTSRLSMWRDCVAPALITFLIAGRSGAGPLSVAIGLTVLGGVSVGWAAGGRQTRSVEPETSESSVEILLPRDVEPSVTESVASVDSSPTHHMATLPQPEVQELHSDDHPLRAQLVGEPLTESEDALGDEPCPAESWTRTESDGEVRIEAVIRARFAEGAKLVVVHLPFVPPLVSVPQIECEPLDSGCDVEIQTEATFRHGARLSVTRPTAGPAESVPIGVVVYTSAEEPVES